MHTIMHIDSILTLVAHMHFAFNDSKQHEKVTHTHLQLHTHAPAHKHTHIVLNCIFVYSLTCETRPMHPFTIDL